jgi:uncharacterized nucleotidyltransferase DUF6036
MTQLHEPWKSFLTEVDEQLCEPVELHCIGGFPLIAFYGVSRITMDIDFLTAIPATCRQRLESTAGLGSPLSKKHRVFLQSVGIADYPDDYDSRLVEFSTGLQHLRLMVVDPYDLLLSKLTRNSVKDREDVRGLAAKLNLTFPILEERFAKEMKPWLPNLERHELTLRLWKEFFQR